MKKKILALILAAVMCVTALSVAVFAVNIEKVPSTIPGTDIAYNRAENVTVKIPGTEITYTFKGVSDKVGVTYKDGIPNYIFAFYELGHFTINNAGEYAGEEHFSAFDDNGNFLGFGGKGDAGQCDVGEEREAGLHDYTVAGGESFSITVEYTDIYEDNTCAVTTYEGESKKVARVSIYSGYGGGKDKSWYPYDLMSCVYDNDLNCYVPAEIEKIDISEIAVSDDEPIIENPQYSVIKGANSVWNSNSNDGLTITADGDFSKFTGIKIDNEIIGSEKYEAKAGSTVVTLKSSYLETLNSGKHTVTFVYINGEVSTQIEIKGTSKPSSEPSNPQNAQIPNTDSEISGAAALYALIAIILVLGIVVIRRKPFVKDVIVK